MESKHFEDTEVMAIDPLHPQPDIIERAAALLREGRLVVLPTETVYGLGADAFQAGAVARIFEAKGRPYSDPLIVHIAELAELERVTTSHSEIVSRLAQAFWPGPLTLIVPAHERVPALVTAGLPTVAVRMPRHPVALALIQALGSPVAAPSANRFMHVSPTTAQHVLADLAERVPLILDGGPCSVGVESTILDLCAPVPTILRPGGVSLEMLRAILPEVQLPVHQSSAGHNPQEAQKSPGQMQTHYAPAVPAILYEGSAAAVCAAMQDEVEKRAAMGQQTGLLLADEDLAYFSNSHAHIYALGSVDAPEQVANRLFAGLRTLEEAGVAVILCRSFAEQGVGLAIRDRLLKATGGAVVRLSCA